MGISDKCEDNQALPDVSESETVISDDNNDVAADDNDEWWPKYDSPEDILNKYMEAKDGASEDDFGYLMYDVNADGCEELIITYQNHISEIYGNYKGKLLQADALSDRSALEVKPETLLYVKSTDGYANLRTGPGTEYEIICQIPNGDEMEMYLKSSLSESGKKWLKVTYYTEADNEDGYSWLTGWIAESQLE